MADETPKTPTLEEVGANFLKAAERQTAAYQQLRDQAESAVQQAAINAEIANKAAAEKAATIRARLAKLGQNPSSPNAQDSSSH